MSNYRNLVAFKEWCQSKFAFYYFQTKSPRFSNDYRKQFQMSYACENTHMWLLLAATALYLSC